MHRHLFRLVLLLLAACPVLGVTDIGCRRLEADEAWERATERAVREQDRLIKSVKMRKGNLGTVVRRYRQQVLNDSSALNYYLLGRASHYAGDPAETARHMRKALEVSPNFYFADLALAIVYLEAQRLQDAEFHIRALRRKKPDNMRGLKLEASLYMQKRDFKSAHRLIEQVLARLPDDAEARRAHAACLVGLKDWQRAEQALRRLVEASPREPSLRRQLIECLLHLEQWDTVIGELRKLLRLVRDDPLVLWQLAIAHFQLKQLDEALVALRRLDGMSDKPTRHVLELMLVIYRELGDWEKFLSTLERLLPLIKKEEEREALREMIRRLRAGEQPQPGPDQPGGSGWARDPVVELIERCVHPEVEVRREALQIYFGTNLPFVDPAIYRRSSPDVEPDPVCRIWVLRILGLYRAGKADTTVVRDVARYVALGLEDPETTVRTVAAEELGRVGQPAGVLYLLPHLTGMTLEPTPTTDHDGRRSMEREFNATRLALSKLTGRRDLPISDGDWVALDRAPAVRAEWKKWLDTPEGLAARMGSLRDLAAIEDLNPRWALRYVLVDVIGASPASLAEASYRLLRDSIAAQGEKAAADPWWKVFPRIPDDQLGEAGVPAMREKMKAWWKAVPREAPKKR